ncbi:HEAT repeat domain-containing protein, partial [bacterium]|nr:HEAT repeat domain-containing protein [bacterium]MBU1614820.1 HEAT repeat domain-containing protein [bacterium]
MMKKILGILFLISAVGIGYAQDTATLAVNNLKDKDWHLRMKAAEDLGKAKETSALEPLIAALSDRSLYVQEKVAWALGEIGDPKAVEPLVAALKSENPFLRRNIAQALAKIGKPSVEPLITLLKEDWGVRGNAAYALVAMGNLAV